MYACFTSKLEPSFTLQPSASRSLKKQVRITKKILTAHGVWQFITMQRVNNRYVSDKRKDHYYIEWWEGQMRCCEFEGQAPTQAAGDQRRIAGVDLYSSAITPDNNLNGAKYGMKVKDILG